MDEEWTSFMRMRQVYHRNAPMAHSRAFLEGPSTLRSISGVLGLSSRERRAIMGDHMSPESHRSGSVVGA